MASVTESVTETTTESWGSRLGSSIKGVIGGILMFFLAFPVLFWNEGNSVKVAKALDEGEGACVPVESVKTVDPDYEGQLIHATAKAETEDILTDDTFGVSTKAIALKRTVEMYQWHEKSETKEKKNLGGSVTKTTTYSYYQGWDDDVIDSSSFHDSSHENPGVKEFESEEKRAENVSFGAFHLNESQISRIGSMQAYAFPTDWVCRVERIQRVGDTIYVPNRVTRDNALNNRNVQSEPRIGDMRVKIEIVRPHVISIVAKQRGDTFCSYLAKTKKKVDLLKDGTADAAEMFEDARDCNSFMTWVVRLLGFLLMYFGLCKVLKPLSVLADVLPILGDILEVGAGVVAGLVAFIFSVTTIAIAWVFYRPVLGIILLLVAAGGVYLLWKKRKAAKAASASATMAPVLVALLACFVTIGAIAAEPPAPPESSRLKDDGTCWAVTEKGTRCKHKKDGASDYCKQHATDKKPAKSVKKCRAMTWNGKQCDRVPLPESYYCKQHAKLGAPKEGTPKEGPKGEPKDGGPKDGPKGGPKDGGPKDGPKGEPKDGGPKDGPQGEPKDGGPKDK